MLYSTVGDDNTSGGGVTTVDCQKQVRSWRLLLSIAKLLVPTCNCNEENSNERTSISRPPKYPLLHKKPSYNTTGTIFGYRYGNVTLCIQTTPTSISPTLLLELSIPTNVLAREMKGGSTRFAFECKRSTDKNSGSLLSTPLWTMYCNGRKVGFAHLKKKASIRAADMEVIRRIGTVVVGAGITRVDGKQDVMYLRGMFERFHGSANSVSFHLVDQDGINGGQELSFYFLRSR